MRTPAPRTPRSTLSDVASRAGVSVTTASLVLGGKAKNHRISLETFERVQKAAGDLDYSPNLLIRSMQRGRTHVLSFYNSFRNRLTNDIYMNRLSTAIESAAGQHGYDVLVHCDFSRSPVDAYRFLNGGQTDGLLLFAPLPDDPLLPLLRRSRLPVLLINSRDEEGILPSVRDDVGDGMRQAAEALVDAGHRRVAAITEEGTSIRDSHERISLLRSSLHTLGADLPENLVLPYAGDGKALVQRILDDPNPPTALFCWRDRLAYFLLESCEELLVPVPQQLAVVGYDGIQWPAATRHVAATVQVDLQKIADASIHLIDRCIRGEEIAVSQETIPVSFTRGTTLGPPFPL